MTRVGIDGGHRRLLQALREQERAARRVEFAISFLKCIQRSVRRAQRGGVKHV